MKSILPGSVSENPVVGPRASVFSTGKDGEAGDISAYRRCSRTASALIQQWLLSSFRQFKKTSRSKLDRVLRQAPRVTLYFILFCTVRVGSGETSLPSSISPSSEYFKPLVLLSSVDKGADSHFSFQYLRVGFVIGDGTLILTAEHCIDDFLAPSSPSSSRRLFAISPYYGDIFPVEILAYDDMADVAVLRAVWPTHPAFALAEPNSLQSGDTSVIPSVPPFKDDQQQINTDFLFEQLTVDRIDHQEPDKAILFTKDGLIKRGWSGSPILLQDTQQVTGVMCQIRGHKETIALFFKRTVLKAAGCHIQSILKLVRANHLEDSALAVPPPAARPDIPDSAVVFGHIQNTFNALVGHDLPTALTHIQQAANKRPNSAYLHLWLAHIASAQEHKTEEQEETLLQLAYASLDTALALAPEDPHILAVNGSIFKKRNKPDLARQFSQAALNQDPNDALALYTLLLLSMNDPNQAVAYGQRLTAIEPNNTMAWFRTSMALLNDRRPEEALVAAQRTVAIDPNGLIREPLAKALTALDRIEEAQVEFEFMTRKCTCANCWFRYASFLLNHQPDQVEKAQLALDTARTEKKRNGMTDRKLDVLQIQIHKQADPNQALVLLRSWLEQDPNNGDTWWRLADILRTKEQYEKAAEAAQKAVSLDPNNVYRPRLADCLAKAGHQEAAQDVFDTMLELHPERPRHWFFYAKYLQESHKPDLARRALDHIDAESKHPWRVSQKERDDLLDEITQSEQNLTP